MILLFSLITGLAAAPGHVLPAAPALPPGTVSPAPEDPLAEARRRLSEADPAGAIALLEPSVAGMKGSAARAAWLLLGTAHAELGNDNVASHWFDRVSRAGGEIASYGVWFEAQADHRRGRHAAAAQGCRGYRTQWPEGVYAGDCLVLIGDALAASGNWRGAWGAYEQYLVDHPESPRGEELRLAKAQAVARAEPARAVDLLRALWLDHSYPSTDLAVTDLLSELAAKGYDTTLPSGLDAQIDRANSLRRSGRFAEAWALYQDISAQGKADPKAAAWAAQNAEKFAWGTRQFGPYVQPLLPRYAARPDGELAWEIYRAYAQDGVWDQAAEWGRRGLKDHAGHGRWREASDTIAQAEMLAGQYDAAADRFAKLSGADARFYAAFCAYMAGKPDRARAGFDDVVAAGGAWRAAGYYWRAQVRRGQGDPSGAAEDEKSAAEADNTGWYLLLTSQQPPEAPPQGEGWVRRDGRWHGDPPLQLPPDLQSGAPPAAQPLPATGWWPEAAHLLEEAWVRLEGKSRPGLKGPEERPVDWSALQWPAAAPAPAAEPAAKPEIARADLAPVPAPAARGSLPTSYTSCRWFDPPAALRSLAAFSQQHKDLWPEIEPAGDLAYAGLFGEAARLVGPAYEEWKAAREAKDAEMEPGRRAQLVARAISADQWRTVFLAAQDHHHAARFCSGMGRDVADEEARRAALRLAWPVVRPAELWAHSQRYDIDPFLLMGIMRQESTYQEFVVSHAGAIGLIQVMPRTGARVAAMMGEHRYSPRDLENPEVNIKYGAFYLSKLLDRFGGAFPIAVASYNGGPHNMSRFYRQLQGKVSLAQFVEHIPYAESRDYVKKVSGHYARYVALYGPEGARLALPEKIEKDDPSIIDF